MDQGPYIPKRTTIGGPPTDLPEQPLLYPGTPLTRRFIPATQPRKFEEPKSYDENKVASDNPFTPVVSVNFVDRDIHIGPVVNEYPRSLTPVALSGRLLLPARGAGIFELPDDIRRPLEARVGRLTTATEKPPATTTTSTDTKTTQPLAEGAAQEQAPSAETASLNTELEQLKGLARQELAKRQGVNQSAELTVTTTAPTPKEPPFQGVETPVTPLPSSPAETTAPGPDDETQKLLSEAEKLEAELTKLQSVIPTTQPPETKEPVTPTATPPHPAPPEPSVPTAPLQTKDVPEEHLAQIDRFKTEEAELSTQVDELRSTKEEAAASIKQLTTEKEELSTKISGLQSANEENVSRLNQRNTEKAELSDKLAQISSANEENLNRISALEAERGKLETKFGELEAAYQEEIQKTQGLQNQIKTLTADFERQLTSAAIENTNLLDEVQKLRKTATESSQTREENEKELSRLQSELTTTQTQRDTAREQVKHIDSLLRELGSKTKAYGKAPVRPKESEETEEPPEEESKVKVVKPQLAVGKMAPALTSTPNVINGVIKDKNRLLLSDVIIVVKDSGGQPVRALKSNKIGQFAISTPLPNGTYTMELESAGHSFDVVEVGVEGKVMHPIEIRAGGGD